MSQLSGALHDLTNARLILPNNNTPPTTGNILEAELFWDKNDDIFLIGKNSSLFYTVVIELNEGNGIQISGTGGKLTTEVKLDTNSGLEFSSTNLRIKPDITSTPGSGYASVLERISNGLSLRVDEVTLTTTGANGNLKVKDNVFSLIDTPGIANRVSYWTSATSVAPSGFLYNDNSNSYLGIFNPSPATRLDVVGLTINTQATNTISTVKESSVFTKNDGLTKTYSVHKIYPTFNFGLSNTSTTVSLLDIDSINTSVSGLTANLIKSSFGGVEKFRVESDGDIVSSGNVTIQGTGNSVFSGNVSIEGNIDLGNSSSDTLTVSAQIDSNLIPNTNDLYTVGDDTHRWADVFVGPGSINIGNSGNLSKISYNTTDNRMEFDPTGSNPKFYIMDGGTIHANEIIKNFYPEYLAENTAFDPEVLDGGATDVVLSFPGEFSSSIVLPFTFDFYGIPYTNIAINSDGYISFNVLRPELYSPNRNIISGYKITIDPSAGGTIKYETFNLAPNRIFVIEYSGVYEFGSVNPNITFQIKLFETSNIIEIHTTSALSDTTPQKEVFQGLKHPYNFKTNYFNVNRYYEILTLNSDAIKFTPVAADSTILTNSGIVTQDIVANSNLEVNGKSNFNDQVKIVFNQTDANVISMDQTATFTSDVIYSSTNDSSNSVEHIAIRTSSVTAENSGYLGTLKGIQSKIQHTSANILDSATGISSEIYNLNPTTILNESFGIVSNINNQGRGSCVGITNNIVDANNTGGVIITGEYSQIDHTDGDVLDIKNKDLVINNAGIVSSSIRLGYGEVNTSGDVNEFVYGYETIINNSGNVVNTITGHSIGISGGSNQGVRGSRTSVDFGSGQSFTNPQSHVGHESILTSFSNSDHSENNGPVGFLSSIATSTATGTFANLTGFYSSFSLNTSDSDIFNVTNLMGYVSELKSNSQSNITNFYSFYSKPITDSFTLTNAYGLYISDITSASSSNYSIYTNTGTVRFGDVVSIENTSNHKIKKYLIKKETTTATPSSLDIGSSIPINAAWTFNVLVSARRTDVDGESAAYEFKGCVDNNSGTTALVGSVTKNVIAEDTVAWDVDITADDTSDVIQITFTGENAKTIKWTASVEIVEANG